jgi:isopentenyl-diphosphate delta-isomerase
MVEETGTVTGLIDLHQAHLPPGHLHLAVSVQLVDDNERWILQRRAASKLLFPLKWANSCCTHPRPDEPLIDAAARRVEEELGLRARDLQHCGTFIYQARDDVSGMVEYELDHVYLGRAVGSASPSSVEVDEVALLALAQAVALVNGDQGAPWASSVLSLATTAAGR